MQNGSLENGHSKSHVNHHLEQNGYATPTSQPDQRAASPARGTSIVQNGDSQHQDNAFDAPPTKKRKLTDPETSKASGPRPISPPWKRVAVEGPTSFLEEGRRKSSRTNFVPIELQPQADKRRTRAAIQHDALSTKSKCGGASGYKSVPLNSSPTQISSNVKRPQSAGKPTIITAIKSPGNAGHPIIVASSQVDHALPAKRSHKKKVPPSPTSSNPSESVPLPNPHQTRRAAHTSEVRTTPQQEQANGWPESDEGPPEEFEEEKIVEMKPNQKLPRLSLKVRMPTVNIQHPSHVVPVRYLESDKEWEEERKQLLERDPEALPLRKLKYDSFQDWVNKEAKFGPEGDVDPNMSEKEAAREADLRNRISKAAKPGGLLSEERCQIYKPEQFEPPPRQYTHQDRLIAHAAYFQKLMQQERTKHLRAAKECAERASNLFRLKQEESYREWKQGQPKTQEEIDEEQRLASKEIWEQLVQDLKKKWIMVADAVEAKRLQEWQDEQDRLNKEAMEEVIENSRRIMHQPRERRASGMDDEATEQGIENCGGFQESSSDDESQDENNMTSSDSESEEGHGMTDDDEGLTQEELRRKYAAIPAAPENEPEDPELDEVDAVDLDPGGIPSHLAELNRLPQTESQDLAQASVDVELDPPKTPPPLEDVDDALMEDSDASIDMDGDMGSSDEPPDEADTGVDDSEEENGFGSLLGSLYRKQLEPNLEASVQEDKQISVKAPRSEGEEISVIPDAAQGPTPSATNSEEPRSQVDEELIVSITQDVTRPARDHGSTSAKYCPTPPQISEEQPHQSTKQRYPTQDTSLPVTPISTAHVRTPVPTLLRGTLREYQHSGLDWLAGLYADHRNGILADEMGLGKTIQTIALLAHLAVEHGAWGPHLIVVPTSVMLNWEIEFKKFLPGFKVLTYYGTQEERKKKRQGWLDDDKWNVWITSYTLITNDQQIFKRKAWHYMILDEAHNIKNFQSLRWQTLLTFKTRARLLLTGTPLQNNLTELWSLMYFLRPGEDQEGAEGFTDLHKWSQYLKDPVNQIMESGQELTQKAKGIITQLHSLLRPYLLRRLKADVEKQMPGKYEHVVYCRLSKRQRYLYDGFMSRAQTRETLASGNTFSIMNALMQLRKVCNHPDLFETRQIVTSFAMPKSAIADFEIKELLVRRRLLYDDPVNIVDLNMINLLPGANEQFSALDTIQRQRLGALGTLRQMTSQQWARIDHKLQFDGTSAQSSLTHYENNVRLARFEGLRHASYLISLRSQRRPLFSHSLMERLRLDIASLPHPPVPKRRAQLPDWYTRISPILSDIVLTLPERSEALKTTVQKFACVTPAAVAIDLTPLILNRKGIEIVHSAQQICPRDPYHEARMRLSIAFPDKRLLQYDCGKLQKLDTLLRTLQAGGHRALIFTQMTRVLDILEQFLNIHGHRYLRLDGATKIEQRQVLTERFNNDDRILAFILSSRSGGIGINLTGADTVIFYDLDWNPAMDKQCQDRCHRIGQTRDVHIYRLVSEYTIEANILRKANQKRMLDDVVIQEGEFTTDQFNKMSVKDMVGCEAFEEGDAEASAAMDRVLGGRGTGKVFEEVEDQEDIAAAKVAEKEITQTDAADFTEKENYDKEEPTTPKTPGPGELMPPPLTLGREKSEFERTTTMEAADSGLANKDAQVAEEELPPSCDEYMMRLLAWDLKDVRVQPPADKGTKKGKKGKEHGVRRR